LTDDGCAIAGFAGSFGVGDWDFWLARTDASGTVHWDQASVGTGDNSAYAFTGKKEQAEEEKNARTKLGNGADFMVRFHPWARWRCPRDKGMAVASYSRL
jgi:hypothetical protein